MEKKYWLYLESYIFIFSNRNKVLLYNSLTYDCMTFTNARKIKEVINKLSKIDNMYCCSLDENDIDSTGFKEFTDYIRSSYSGDLIEQSIFNGKPVLLPPVLNLQYDVNKLKLDNERSVGENIRRYISTINIYIGGPETNSLLAKMNVFRQVEYTKITNQQEISFDFLKSFLSETEGSNLKSLKIIGGNIFKNSKLKLINNYFNKFTLKIDYFSHYLDIPSTEQIINSINGDNNKLTILIDFPIQPQNLETVIISTKSLSIELEYFFAVTSLNEYNEAENLIDKYCLLHFEIKPVFNGNNLQFFKDFIFMNIDDIENNHQDKREIFTKQVLNTNDFGKITIMENGDIYANINKNKLGSIQNDTLTDVLVKELENELSWRRVRNSKPCCDCIYQWLCPSPSNYELVLDTPNLCTIEIYA